jgi:pyruvate-formate lyase-activating enzyme
MFKSCRMCAGLFIKSSGKLACECNVGYHSEIGDADAQHVGAFLRGPLLQHIRASFATGREPFPHCAKCFVRLTRELCVERGIDIHVEPVNFCQLSCPYCTATIEKATKVNRTLPLRVFQKALAEIAASAIGVNDIIFVGYGEPLLHPELPIMVQCARGLFPSCRIIIDTNANFPPSKAQAIANCGASLIKMSVDGANQATYGVYRIGGSFDKAMIFAKALAEACCASHSATRLSWKYILFNHNDGDDQIKSAVRQAAELGVEIAFDVTCSPNYSQRPLSEILAVAGPRAQFTCTLDEGIVHWFSTTQYSMKNVFDIDQSLIHYALK